MSPVCHLAAHRPRVQSPRHTAPLHWAESAYSGLEFAFVNVLHRFHNTGYRSSLPWHALGRRAKAAYRQAALVHQLRLKIASLCRNQAATDAGTAVESRTFKLSRSPALSLLGQSICPVDRESVQPIEVGTTANRPPVWDYVGAMSSGRAQP